MQHHGKVRLTPLLASVVLAILALFIGFVLTSEMTGSANLPNGSPIAIRTGFGGFACGEQQDLSWVRIAGRRIEFRATDASDAYSITVDGVPTERVVQPGQRVTISSTWTGTAITIGDEEFELD